MEQIAPGSRILVGKKAPVEAVVCSIRPRRVEVVYLNHEHKALHQEIEWKKGAWEFVGKLDDGHSADKDPRVAPYVKILRSPR